MSVVRAIRSRHIKASRGASRGYALRIYRQTTRYDTMEEVDLSVMFEGVDDEFEGIELGSFFQTSFLRDNWQEDVIKWLQEMSFDRDSPFDDDSIAKFKSDSNVFALVRLVLSHCGWSDDEILSFVDLVDAIDNNKSIQGVLPLFHLPLPSIYTLKAERSVLRRIPATARAVERKDAAEVTRKLMYEISIRGGLKANGNIRNMHPGGMQLIRTAFQIKKPQDYATIVFSIHPAAHQNAIDPKEDDVFLALVNEINRLLAFDDEYSKTRILEYSIFYGLVHPPGNRCRSVFCNYQDIQRRVVFLKQFSETVTSFNMLAETQKDFVRKWDAHRTSPLSTLPQELVPYILSFSTVAQNDSDCLPMNLKDAYMVDSRGPKFPRRSAVFLQHGGDENEAALELNIWRNKIASVMGIANDADNVDTTTTVGHLWSVQSLAKSIRNTARLMSVCKAWNPIATQLLPFINVELKSPCDALVPFPDVVVDRKFSISVWPSRTVKRRHGNEYHDEIEHLPYWFLPYVSSRIDLSIGMQRGHQSVFLADKFVKSRTSQAHVTYRKMACASIETCFSVWRASKPGSRKRVAHTWGEDYSPSSTEFSTIPVLGLMAPIDHSLHTFEIPINVGSTTKKLSTLNDDSNDVRIKVACGNWGGRSSTITVKDRRSLKLLQDRP